MLFLKMYHAECKAFHIAFKKWLKLDRRIPSFCSSAYNFEFLRHPITWDNYLSLEDQSFAL